MGILGLPGFLSCPSIMLLRGLSFGGLLTIILAMSPFVRIIGWADPLVAGSGGGGGGGGGMLQGGATIPTGGAGSGVGGGGGRSGPVDSDSSIPIPVICIWVGWW